MGFNPGDPFSITFTLADYGVVGNPEDASSSTYYDWLQVSTETPPLFAEVAFTGSSGAYVNPEDPVMTIHVTPWPVSNTMFFLTAETDSPESSSGVGLTLGGVEVRAITAEFVAGEPFENLGVDGWNPEDFLSSVYGTYGGTTTYGAILLTNNESLMLNFTEMTIGAIPEPSTYASLAFGVSALALLARRRRL